MSSHPSSRMICCKADKGIRTHTIAIKIRYATITLRGIIVKLWVRSCLGSSLYPGEFSINTISAVPYALILRMPFIAFNKGFTTQKRLELSTFAVTGRHSNQLSYWATFLAPAGELNSISSSI